MFNADMNQLAYESASSMDWQESPSGTVRRKRFHLAGEAESGQVTSLVEYLPNASFPYHDHPDGEEILVLSGVFSDQQGDWPAGTHLLNPEGFGHAPFSHNGCVLLVKLRQYAGLVHRHQQIDTRPVAGIERQPLDKTGDENTSILRLGPDLTFSQFCPGGAELFLIEGQCCANGRKMGKYDWMRLPVGSELKMTSQGALIVYLKVGGVARLRSIYQADDTPAGMV